MFRSQYQGKHLTIYHSIGRNPLANWSVQSDEGELITVQDDILKSNVLQIQSPNTIGCSITTPADTKESLGIRLPYLTFLLKNIGRHFTLEITVLDNQNFRRRLRASTYQTATHVSTFMNTFPLSLNNDWNIINFNLATFTNNAFHTVYVETVRVQIHANCRLRRVYFSDGLYTEEQLPNDYRLRPVKLARAKHRSTLKQHPAV